jgi:hypothetical protein
LSYRRYILLLLAITLSGCSQHVLLSQEFPVPVMRKIQAPVILYIPPELGAYIHREKPEKGADWTIVFGDANAKLFEAVLQGMFEPLSVVYSLDGVPDNATIIRPVMHDYQFSTPGMSKGDYYEVWIKYSLQLVQPKHTQLLDWHFTVYGREESSGSSAANAMREASRRAMRDGAAAVVLGFPRQAKVRDQFGLPVVKR